MVGKIVGGVSFKPIEASVQCQSGIPPDPRGRCPKDPGYVPPPRHARHKRTHREEKIHIPPPPPRRGTRTT
jgi:hypothetical protein